MFWGFLLTVHLLTVNMIGTARENHHNLLRRRKLKDWINQISRQYFSCLIYRFASKKSRDERLRLVRRLCNAGTRDDLFLDKRYELEWLSCDLFPFTRVHVLNLISAYVRTCNRYADRISSPGSVADYHPVTAVNPVISHAYACRLSRICEDFYELRQLRSPFLSCLLFWLINRSCDIRIQCLISLTLKYHWLLYWRVNSIGFPLSRSVKISRRKSWACPVWQPRKAVQVKFRAFTSICRIQERPQMHLWIPMFLLNKRKGEEKKERKIHRPESRYEVLHLGVVNQSHARIQGGKERREKIEAILVKRHGWSFYHVRVIVLYEVVFKRWACSRVAFIFAVSSK